MQVTTDPGLFHKSNVLKKYIYIMEMADIGYIFERSTTYFFVLHGWIFRLSNFGNVFIINYVSQ